MRSLAHLDGQGSGLEKVGDHRARRERSHGGAGLWVRALGTRLRARRARKERQAASQLSHFKIFILTAFVGYELVTFWQQHWAEKSVTRPLRGAP